MEFQCNDVIEFYLHFFAILNLTVFRRMEQYQALYFV